MSIFNYMHQLASSPPKGVFILWWCFVRKIKSLEYFLKSCMMNNYLEAIGICLDNPPKTILL